MWITSSLACDGKHNKVRQLTTCILCRAHRINTEFIEYIPRLVTVIGKSTGCFLFFFFFFFFFYQKQIGKQILCFRLLGSRQVEKRVCANINYIKIAVSGNDSEKREDCSWGCLAHFSAHEVNDNVKFSIYALNVVLKSGLK